MKWNAYEHALICDLILYMRVGLCFGKIAKSWKNCTHKATKVHKEQESSVNTVNCILSKNSQIAKQILPKQNFLKCLDSIGFCNEIFCQFWPFLGQNILIFLLNFGQILIFLGHFFPKVKRFFVDFGTFAFLLLG